MTRALVAAAVACLASAAPGAAQPVELVSFQPEARALRSGDVARSSLTIRNAGPGQAKLWVGYSVGDSTGMWYDVPAVSVTLTAGAQGTQTLDWRVPPTARAGSYRVVMAVWTAPPGTAGAGRLVSADRAHAFRVRGNPELLMEQPVLPWRVASHRLGRGTMQPTAVFTDGAAFRLVLGAGQCDGAEMRSAEPVGFGRYGARMRVPDAPGSLSAIFLYGEGSGDNDEIDIEIFNDGSRRALLTAWIGGRKSRETEIRLPFDPRSGFHDYEIDWTRDALMFRIDRRQVARWTRDFPTSRMRVVSNVWWPTWLECRPPSSDRALEIESIRVDSAPSGRPPD